MEISSVLEEGNYVIAINGDVDASSSILLDEAIGKAVEEGQQYLLIDCLNLTYISSAGLGVFMSYIEEIKEKNIRMVLFGLSDKVKNVFKVLGLDQLLNIKDTKDQAIKQFHG
jgi:anti-sigma B factor antagonist